MTDARRLFRIKGTQARIAFPYSTCLPDGGEVTLFGHLFRVDFPDPIEHPDGGTLIPIDGKLPKGWFK